MILAVVVGALVVVAVACGSSGSSGPAGPDHTSISLVPFAKTLMSPSELILTARP